MNKTVRKVFGMTAVVSLVAVEAMAGYGAQGGQSDVDDLLLAPDLTVELEELQSVSVKPRMTSGLLIARGGGGGNGGGGGTDGRERRRDQERQKAKKT